MMACPDCGDVVRNGVGPRRLCPGCYVAPPAPGRLLNGGQDRDDLVTCEQRLGFATFRPGAVMILSMDGPVTPAVRSTLQRALPRPALPSARTREVGRLGFGGGMPRWMMVR